jgi:predicted helicase
MNLDQYIEKTNIKYKAENATEHTYRGLLEQLIESIVPEIKATNEPKRQSCGAPDYILTRKDIPVGFIEAKDIADKDLLGLKKTGNKEQFDRYKASLNNLIFTDYLDFYLFIDGEFKTSIRIGQLVNDSIVAIPENFAEFTNLIKNFCSHIGQTIKSSKKLAEMMATKARLLSEVIEKALNSDETHNEDSSLKDQMKGFKDILIHDITPKGFADVYAQTIAYGMFAARLHDPTLPTFSRQEAAELIPKSNPFLRKLFGYIAGPDIDDRITWIVDSLVEVFLACNVEELLKNYGKTTGMADPIIHFYETFLSEYDPALRKARGVWYTPQPVVNFIVRAVDDILKNDFDLPQGLADTSKTKIKTIVESKATADARSKIKQTEIEQEIHRVQILDPATGTGTFLAEVVKHIHQKFEGQKGIWSNYVENHLIPRLNGFELLMASYAMAHLKLDLLYKETGYKATKKDQRFKIFLTNSLEEHYPDTGTLFANWLSSEANEANHIKRDTPVMCIIGNPPYSVSSSNKSEWIEKLTADYKKDLNERNIQPLSDDYIKFIRFGQHFVQKNGSGILAYISNNSFIDGIIHRQMRKNLLENFDKIYVLDLHGNAKKKETAPDGSADQNVFDIMQGVSINIFVNTGREKVGESSNGELGELYHYDLQGKREAKYEFLTKNSLKTIEWNKLMPNSPNYFLVKKDFDESGVYEKGFKVDELFKEKGSGIKFRKDNLLVKNHFNSNDVKQMIHNIHTLSKSAILHMYDFKETDDWRLDEKKVLFRSNDYDSIIPVNYRPFDFRYTYYPIDRISEIIPRGDSRRNLMRNITMGSLGFMCFRQSRNGDIGNFGITKYVVSKDILSSLDSATVFPLYLYSESTGQLQIVETSERTPNLNPAIVQKIAEGLGLEFVNEKSKINVGTGHCPVSTPDTFAPIDILDYIYAVLHSPSYREKYKEFLKIDFPKVPYPKDAETFWALVNHGSALRQIHLLEHPNTEKYITQYPEDGDNVVIKPRFVSTMLNDHGKVYINDTQYFDNVPQIAWEFYIGGYQPAQKWLKDRKERTLGFEDILHYQKIIVALTETDKIMKAIDLIKIE